jgi:hypothetical protein
VKSRVVIEPDNVPGGINHLLWALEPEDADKLLRAGERLSAFGALLRQLKRTGPKPGAPAEPTPGKAPPAPASPPRPARVKSAKPRASEGTGPLAGISKAEQGRRLRRQIAEALLAGPLRVQEIAERTGLKAHVVQNQMKSPEFEKDGEGKYSPYRLSPSGRAALANSTSEDSKAASGAAAGGPATSPPSTTPTA